MNRFITARDNLNKHDELVWYKRRPDNSFWKCLWRKGKGHITFVAQEVIDSVDDNGYSIRRDGKIKIVFSIQDKNNDWMNLY